MSIEIKNEDSRTALAEMFHVNGYSYLDLVITSPPYKDEDGYTDDLIHNIFTYTYDLQKDGSLLFLNFGHLADFKTRPFEVVKILKSIDANFSLNTLKANELDHYKTHLSEGLFNLLGGTIINRDIAREARAELNKQSTDHRMIGKLLNEHQKVLRDVLGISTFKINKMIDAALDAGAYGAKINGSGGGGCMFAYAPESPEKVKAAIEIEEGEGFIINSDSGSGEEPLGEINWAMVN